MRDQLVARLLGENRATDPNFREGHLANHFPMALLALDALGASTDRLASFGRPAHEYREPLRDDRLPRHEWTEAILERGLGVVLAHVLPSELPQLGGDAFHPLIRLGHALDWATSGRPPADEAAAEVAHALAYLARNHDVFVPSAGAPTTSSARAILEQVRAEAQPPLSIPGRWGGLVSEQMRVLGRTRSLAGRAADLAVHEGTLGELRGVARALYAAHDDFTTLHLVTACRAARVVRGHLPQHLRPDFDRAFWCHFLLAFRALAPVPGHVARPLPTDVPDWATIAKRATASSDDHTFKLVHAARDEDAIDPDPIYRKVAWRAALRGASTSD